MERQREYTHMKKVKMLAVLYLNRVDIIRVIIIWKVVYGYCTQQSIYSTDVLYIEDEITRNSFLGKGD